MEERLRSLLIAVRPVAVHRVNGNKEIFGKDSVVPTTDPRKTWKQQQADAAARAAERKGGSGDGGEEVGGKGDGGGGGGGGDGDGGGGDGDEGTSKRKGASSQHTAGANSNKCGARTQEEDERRLSSVKADGDSAKRKGEGKPTAAKANAIVKVEDVLYLLEREPQSSRSRVVQWWRCEGRPLARYARRASRLFVPNGEAGAAAETEDGGTAAEGGL
eukprot:2035685-Pleurochrysis_carterae.AAC.1